MYKDNVTKFIAGEILGSYLTKMASQGRSNFSRNAYDKGRSKCSNTYQTGNLRIDFLKLRLLDYFWMKTLNHHAYKILMPI
jgi:hypothetical protein